MMMPIPNPPPPLHRSDPVGEHMSGTLPSFYLLDLPVDCLLRLLQLLDPIHLCRIATTCKSLRHAADSDASWSSKVPILPPASATSSMKQIYYRLRSQVPRKYWSDPAIAHGCFLMPARQLHITWGDDPWYWQWSRLFAGSWFSEVAYLKAVCWLEIRGSCEMVFRPGRYLVSFRICLNDINGFQARPLTLSLSTSDGQCVENQQWFQGDQSRIEAPLGRMGTSDWLELEVGEFVVEDERLLNVEVSMIEIEGGVWKQGLVVDCIKIQAT